jgi:hypothetical protein
MNGKKDKAATDSGQNEDRSEEPAETKRSGRVQFDERGNPVWEWQIQTGVFGRDISTQRLERLTPAELAHRDWRSQCAG